jgi:[acyl-carrier-protein] S-malonyltransferase
VSYALLFPGQGTQHPLMLPWLDAQPAAAATLAGMAALIGGDWRERLADAEAAADNRFAQLLLTGVGIAAWQCLANALPPPTAVAGYSVGELAAFCAAGVLAPDTALALALDRAEAMQASVAALSTGLMAVQGPGGDAITGLCQRLGLAVSIRLAADRVILGGPDDALDAAHAELEPAGARCTRLAVKVASHTPWMASAALVFGARLSGIPFAPPRAVLICNAVGAALRRPADLARALADQIAATVPWDRCQDAIAERRVRCVLEVGPGTTLSRLWNERHPEVPARSVDEFRSPEAVVRWIRAESG